MTTVVPTLCDACARRRAGGTCTSFPEGIPDEVFRYGYDHRETIAGEPPFELDPVRRAEFDLWLSLQEG